MKAKLVVPLALVFVLLGAVPIYAAAPVIESGEVNIDVHAYWCPNPDNREFEILDNAIYTYRETSFYDSKGTLLSYHFHAVGTDNLYNPANPAVRLTGHFTSNDIYDVRADKYTVAGTFLSITIPPQGKVVQIAGRRNYATGIFVGIDTASDENWALICEALAGN